MLVYRRIGKLTFKFLPRAPQFVEKPRVT
jgi:hypothetical protein